MDVRPVFTQRAEDVARAFTFTGAAVPAADEMERADADVASRVADFEDRLTGANGDLAAVAVKATSGKAADMKALREQLLVLQATGTPAYRQAVRAAANQFRANLDRKDWSNEALVKSMVPAARERMATISTQAVDSLKALPASIQAEVLAGRNLGTHVTGALDLSTVTGDQVEAARTCEWAWRIIDNTWNGDFERQALAIHRGRTTTQEAEDAERREVAREHNRTTANTPVGSIRRADNAETEHAARHGDLDSHMAMAVWADTQAMEAMAAGMGLESAVLNGHGSISGLVDPYGKDADEFSARLSAFSAVRGWLATQADNRTGTRRHPGDYSGTPTEALHVRAGFPTPEAALSAYRAK